MHKSKLNLRKLLGQPTTPSDTSHHNGSSGSRPVGRQDCSYDAGTPITCVDRSSDGRQAIIAAAKVFKVLRIDGTDIKEGADLRLSATNQAAKDGVPLAVMDNLNIRAVKWLHDVMDSTIITASGNGRMAVYDLKRGSEGMEVSQVSEHARPVHKLAINPFKCNWLLTASQDGTVKSFDLRNTMLGRGGPVIGRQSFKCNADAVRDVAWSPTDGMEFACCTDAGIVQKWDIRKPTAPVLKVSAHQSACTSIAWHSDGQHLVSGGSDHHVYVWDVSNEAERNQKPKYSMVTCAPVAHVSWRPSTWSHTAQARRAAQIAVAYEDSFSNRTQNAAVHIWDVARPALPFKELDHWDSAPRDLVWNSRDILWGVSRDGHFVQSDVAFAPRLIDRKSPSTFAISHTGEAAMLLESRQFSRRRQGSHHSLESTPRSVTTSTDPRLSLSRSDSEEDVASSFLAPRQRPGHQRRLSQRTALPVSSTQSNPMMHIDTKIMNLEDAVEVTGEYWAQQVLSTGQVPAAHARALHNMLSQRYMVRMEQVSRMARGQPLNQHVMHILEYYAKCAEYVGHYRLAQTWRLLAFVLRLLMSRRAEYHRKWRVAMRVRYECSTSKASPAKADSIQFSKLVDIVDAKKVIPQSEVKAKSLITEEIESTSNVATPLVRPLRDEQGAESFHKHGGDLDVLTLPPAELSRIVEVNTSAAPSMVNTGTGAAHEVTNTYTPKRQDVQDEAGAKTRKKPLQYSVTQITAEQPRLARHVSTESFQMFSTSGESQIAESASSAQVEPQSIPQNGNHLKQNTEAWDSSLRIGGVLAPAPPAASESSDDSTSPSKSYGYHKPAPIADARRPHTRISPPMLRLQEASSENPDIHVSRLRSASKLSDSPNIVGDDWLPWPGDPDFVIDALDPSRLIQRTIEYESQTGSMNATACVLLLRPFIALNTISTVQALAIIRQQHSRLVQMRCFVAATLLRKVCVPQYPDVYSGAQNNVSVGFFCTSCNKPLENDPLIPGSVWQCPRCEQPRAACAVCKHRDVQENMSYDGMSDCCRSNMWWLCPGCGHGGHTACMKAWHGGPEFAEGSEHSDGCCALEGCLHPCLAGRWRDRRASEKRAAKSRELDVSVRASVKSLGGLHGSSSFSVRRDQKDVPPSRAVDVARLTLGVKGRAPVTVGRRTNIARALSAGGMGGYEAG